MPPAISIRAEEIFHIGSFPVTNSLLLSTLVLVVLAVAALAAKRRFSLIPGKIQNLLELGVEQLLDLITNIIGDRDAAERYLPLIATIFFFILFANWFGLLPGIGSFVITTHGERIPVLRSPSADLNFTLALALITVVVVNIIGAIAVGFKSHASKFFNFSGPIQFFVGILEIISELAKIVSFSFRLFGNVFAGEVLLTIIAFLIPYLVPLPFLFLEVFVGFIQAFIFTMLTIVFVGLVTAEHEAHAH